MPLKLHALLFLAVLWFILSIPSAAAQPTTTLPVHPSAEIAYVGDDTCRACHIEKTTNYHQTAHYFTSRPATTNSILGKFSPGDNVLRTADTNLIFEMLVTTNGHAQKAVRTVSPSRTGHRTEPFDIVIGSGRKGQSYAFWKTNLLCQLPVSYWTELDEWVNSPGYPDGIAVFDRPITPRCLECHATTFESIAPPPHQYNKNNMVLGIACEKCHGPGAEHVARFRSASPPKLPDEMATLNPARFSRERQIDVCGLCHGGGGEPIGASLTFVPGDVLEKHLRFPDRNPTDRVDVHGSQVVLMERSRCFQAGNTMTCSTCHDVHTPQRDIESYASKCLTCHKVESCGTFSKHGHAIDRQCITCHMPLQETSLIISKVNGKQVQPKVRNHKIGIYPDVKLP